MNTQDAKQAIGSAHRVLVTSHVDPDGDAVGSGLAFASLVRELGKDVDVVTQDPIPRLYEFLPGADTAKRPNQVQGEYDTCVVLDCASLERVGSVQPLVSSSRVIVNIDHHFSNTNFGQVNLVFPEASATAAIVVRLVDDFDMPIGKDRATNLYAAMIADTGSFRYSNSSAESLKTCARLVDEGADPTWVAANIFGRKGLPGLRLLGEALLSLEVLNGGSVAMISLSRDSFEKHGASTGDCEGFVNYAQSLKGVRVGILLRETEQNVTKASFRSDGSTDVDQLARMYGGGGHPTAAGARISGPLHDAKKRVLEGVENFLLAHRNNQNR